MPVSLVPSVLGHERLATAAERELQVVDLRRSLRTDVVLGRAGKVVRPRVVDDGGGTLGRRGAPRWSSALCVLLIAACSVLWSAGPALAHTSLLRSTPASSADVVDPDEVVTLVFDQPVSPRQVQIVVTGPDGADVAGGPAQVSGGTVSTSVTGWPMSGSFRLAYRVLAQDGHPLTGQVPFQVTLSAAGTAPAATATTTVPPPVTGPAQAPAQAAPSAGLSVAPVLIAVLSGGAVLLVLGGVRAGRRAEAGR